MKGLAVIALALILIATIVPAFWAKKNGGHGKADLQIASASSFAPFLQSLTPQIKSTCQIRARISTGASGTLATQILNGAPFDLFFSADAKRPQALIKAGKGTAVSTYALGQLVYWQPSPPSPDGRPLALADPALAPYGIAAIQSIKKLKQQYVIPAKQVIGRNAAQAFQFVQSGAAAAGLVPLSLVRAAGIDEDKYVLIAADWYAPIHQDVVVLHPSKATECVLVLLARAAVQARMQDAGFKVP
ncbi:MAG: molybdate ABC transporter substrate-binding protein [Robiginitomaculum sp.]|nr:molybdate ABC transporter substrate-binding protein [Robiginitomaculum sp.]MDQ7077435.1 molybdate ABC transporter substrate-binding protein [Robiginitomaculum sp.]